MQFNNVLTWIHTADALPEPTNQFGWSAAVLCHGPCEGFEDYFVGSYSHHLDRWQVCGTDQHRPCRQWAALS